MIQSMTGFGSSESRHTTLGKVYVELKSTNHKSLEIGFRLPEGLSFLEDRIRKEIEARVLRGRVNCTINILAGHLKSVFVDKALVREYISSLGHLQQKDHLQGPISLDALINLPGVLSLVDNRALLRRFWPLLKKIIDRALAKLVRSRQKEGGVLVRHLRFYAEDLQKHAEIIRARFKKAVNARLSAMKKDEERLSFLKETDISEELERLAFHLKNLKNKLTASGPRGKELDFIAQEIQRESNTIGAKTFDAHISERVVEIKSQVEKIREQLQNIE